MIIYESDTDIIKNKLYELIDPSVKDSEIIKTQEGAYKYISMLTVKKHSMLLKF